MLPLHSSLIFWIHAVSAIKVCTVLEQAVTMRKSNLTVLSHITSDDQLRGFDVDVRKHLFKHVFQNYSVSVDSSYGALNVRVRTDECDVGWAAFFLTATRERCEPDPASDACRPLDANALNALAGTSTINSWEPYRCCIDYLPAYYTSEVKILSLAREDAGGFFLFTVQLLVEPFVINFYCFLFIWCVIMGVLVWLAERHQNPDEFPKAFLNGVDDALWWSFVTITTVGYGDKTPKTPAGRLLGVVWMGFGLALFSILTGHMGSRFWEVSTRMGLDNVADLGGLRVCSYPSTFAQWYMPTSVDAIEVHGDSVADCGGKLRDGLADAIVMEGEYMAFWALNDPWAVTQNLHFSPAIATIPMGLMFAETTNGRAMREMLSPMLLELFESSFLYDLKQRWFREPEHSAAAAILHSPQYELIGPALGMILAYVVLLAMKSAFPSRFRAMEEKSMQGLEAVARTSHDLSQLARQRTCQDLSTQLARLGQGVPSPTTAASISVSPQASAQADSN